MANIKLELVKLRKEFGELNAVDDFSIAIEESETMATDGKVCKNQCKTLCF